ncbi:MAG TPA: nickel pincer cofactor biosynthesis protein LarB [Clostridiales bacterium]|nr:nickel pincer cofactor biosynthesis protein LarB [Clostridiales bacterium]
MENARLKEWLQRYKVGELSEAEILALLAKPSYAELGFAKVDLDRENRNGFAEVVYGEGKTVAQIREIVETLYEKSQGNILATRCSMEAAYAVQKVIPEAEYHELAKVLSIYKQHKALKGDIAVVSAGTADLPVAEEAALTAEIMGNRVRRIYDVGVAGIHRLFAKEQELQAARVLIVVAGMDGALPSVVGGLLKKPLIAVPTDIGYGANFGGLAPLLAMLNSCAAGVSVVNINNGFGAACAASRINQLV